MKARVVMAIAIFGASSATMASPYSPYIGGSLGKIDHDLPNFSKGTTLEFRFGNKFNKNVSVEASYVDFGEANDGIAPVWTASGDTMAISGKLAAPISDTTNIFLQAGFHAWDVQVEQDGAGVILTDDGTDMLFGFGAEMQMNEKVMMGLKYISYDLGDDASTAISIGVDYRL